MSFRVGPDEFRFGEILDRLQHPTVAEGYLPIPEIRYAHASEVYKLEVFASTDPVLAENGVILVKFSLVSGTNGIITVEVDSPAFKFAEGTVTDNAGQGLVCFDEAWTWERQRAHAKISTSRFATLAIATKPMGLGKTIKMESGDKAEEKGNGQGNARQRSSLPPEGGVPTPAGTPPSGGSAVIQKESVLRPDQSLVTSAATRVNYDQQRALCIETWRRILAGAMKVETPEPLVNNAWKNLIIQDYSLINGDRLNYSAGNQYEKMYAAESNDGS